jgi:hypothetical protein
VLVAALGMGGALAWTAHSLATSPPTQKKDDSEGRGKPAKEEPKRASGDFKIARVKASTYFGKWKTGDLLAKYCERPQWSYDPKKDLVEFQGMLKKGGQKLVVHFQVYYDWVDKSNTRKDWIVFDQRALLAGKEQLVWRPIVFVDEERLMRGNDKGEK